MARIRLFPPSAPVAQQVPSQAQPAKVIQFPVSAADRRRNTMGARYVECLLSGYWLQFQDESMVFDGIDYVRVAVMTARSWTADGRPVKPRRETQLMVARSELLRALGTVRPRAMARPRRPER